MTLYVDESGEAGIRKVRADGAPGASPYMTLGAALIADRHREDFEATLEAIREEVRKKQLHCSELNHYQILHYGRRLMGLEMALFGVISRKDTLGQYKDRIDGDSHKYFNKCVQYLLERVGWYMEAHSIPKSDVAIVFEKANRDYSRMENFLWQVQSNPLQPMAANDSGAGAGGAGGNRVTKVYATSSGSGQPGETSKAASRTTGLGSRFKAAPARQTEKVK